MLLEVNGEALHAPPKKKLAFAKCVEALRSPVENMSLAVASSKFLPMLTPSVSEATQIVVICAEMTVHNMMVHVRKNAELDFPKRV